VYYMIDDWSVCTPFTVGMMQSKRWGNYVRSATSSKKTKQTNADEDCLSHRKGAEVGSTRCSKQHQTMRVAVLRGKCLTGHMGKMSIEKMESKGILSDVAHKTKSPVGSIRCRRGAQSLKSPASSQLNQWKSVWKTFRISILFPREETAGCTRDVTMKIDCAGLANATVRARKR
jgi:hypothetical protein